MPRASSTGSLPRTTQERRKAFLELYNPDAQWRLCRNPDDCVMGDHPTLAQVRKEFGENMSKAWLVPQLVDLSEYCGCKEKMSVRMLEQCAVVIDTEYPYLRITDIMLFFHRFKSGYYGRFFGAVDPMLITSSLRQYLADRGVVIERHEQRRREEEAERERNESPPISWEEFCRRHGREGSPNPLGTDVFGQPGPPNVK